MNAATRPALARRPRRRRPLRRAWCAAALVWVCAVLPFLDGWGPACWWLLAVCLTAYTLTHAATALVATGLRRYTAATVHVAGATITAGALLLAVAAAPDDVLWPILASAYGFAGDAAARRLTRSTTRG